MEGREEVDGREEEVEGREGAGEGAREEWREGEGRWEGVGEGARECWDAMEGEGVWARWRGGGSMDGREGEAWCEEREGERCWGSEGEG